MQRTLLLGLTAATALALVALDGQETHTQTVETARKEVMQPHGHLTAPAKADGDPEVERESLVDARTAEQAPVTLLFLAGNKRQDFLPATQVWMLPRADPIQYQLPTVEEMKSFGDAFLAAADGTLAWPYEAETAWMFASWSTLQTDVLLLHRPKEGQREIGFFRHRKLEVQVLDAKGNPVEGIKLFLCRPEDQGWGLGSMEKTDGAGRARLRFDAVGWKSGPPMPHAVEERLLQVYVPGQEPMAVPWRGRIEDAETLRIHLPPLVPVEVQVLGAVGAETRGKVRLKPQELGARARQTVEQDLEHGRVHFPGVQGGITYEVELLTEVQGENATQSILLDAALAVPSVEELGTASVARTYDLGERPQLHGRILLAQSGRQARWSFRVCLETAGQEKELLELPRRGPFQIRLPEELTEAWVDSVILRAYPDIFHRGDRDTPVREIRIPVGGRLEGKLDLGSLQPEDWPPC